MANLQTSIFLIPQYINIPVDTLLYFGVGLLIQNLVRIKNKAGDISRTMVTIVVGGKLVGKVGIYYYISLSYTIKELTNTKSLETKNYLEWISI